MKKIIILISFLLAFLLPNIGYAENYKGCDQISSFKFIDDNNYSFICKKNFKYFIVLNKKIITKKYDKNIGEYTISNNLKNVAFTLENSTNYSEIDSGEISIGGNYSIHLDYMVYLNDIPYKNFSYSRGLEFSQDSKDLYFIANKNRILPNISYSNALSLNDENNILIKNGLDITPKGLSNIFGIYFSDNGDIYFEGLGTDSKQNIYKNLQKAFNYEESYNLNLNGNNNGFIGYKLGYRYVIINGEEKYKSKKILSSLDLKDNGDYYFHEQDGDNYDLIKKSQIILSGKNLINTIFSQNYSNSGSIDFSENSSNYNINYNGKVVYSGTGGVLFMPYFLDNNTFLYEKNGCTLNQNGDIIGKEFCENGFFYSFYSSNDKNITVIDTDGENFKINDKLLNTKGKFSINFLGFSPKTNKIGIEIDDFKSKHVYIIK